MKAAMRNRYRGAIGGVALLLLSVAVAVAAATMLAMPRIAASAPAELVQQAGWITLAVAALLALSAWMYLWVGALRRLRAQDREQARWWALNDDVLRAIPYGFFLIGADFRLRDPISPALPQLLKCVLWPGMNLIEVLRPMVHAQTLDSVRVHMRELLGPDGRAHRATARNPLAEVTLPGSVSKQIQLEFRFERVERDGLATGLLVIVTDVSEHTRVSRELSGARLRLRAQIDALILALGHDSGRIKLCLDRNESSLDRLRKRLRQWPASDEVLQRQALFYGLLDDARTLKHEAEQIDLELIETPAHWLELDLLELSERDRLSDDDRRRLDMHAEHLCERIGTMRELLRQIDRRGCTESAAATGAASVAQTPGPFPTRMSRLSPPPPPRPRLLLRSSPYPHPQLPAVLRAPPPITIRTAMSTVLRPARVVAPSSPVPVSRAESDAISGTTPGMYPDEVAMRVYAGAPASASRINGERRHGMSETMLGSRFAMDDGMGDDGDPSSSPLFTAAAREDCPDMKHESVSDRIKPMWSEPSCEEGDESAAMQANDKKPRQRVPDHSTERNDSAPKLSPSTCDLFASPPKPMQTSDGRIVPPPAQLALTVWITHAKRLADPRGKVVRIESELDPLELLPVANITLLREIGAELIANAVVHGIEPVSTRIRAGKRSAGVVRLALSCDERGGWEFIVRDDGHGIELTQLRSALQRNGCDPDEIDRMSDRDALIKIFEPGVSTAADGADSARGQGLPRVMAYLKSIDARMSMSTSPGKHTEFRMRWTLPG